MTPTLMPFAVPGWEKPRAAECFHALAGQIHGMARQTFERDGNHAEMLFFLPPDGKGSIALWEGGDRDEQAGWIRRHIHETYAFGVIHVVKAWSRFADKPGDHTLRQIQAGEMRVSDLRPEDRTEVLMVCAQSRDGWATSWIDEVLRDAVGKPSLGASRSFADFEGRFGKLFG
jgi:hypothetical protein